MILFVLYYYYCVLLNWTVLGLLWHTDIPVCRTNKGVLILILSQLQSLGTAWGGQWRNILISHKKGNVSHILSHDAFVGTSHGSDMRAAWDALKKESASTIMSSRWRLLDTVPQVWQLLSPISHCLRAHLNASSVQQWLAERDNKCSCVPVAMIIIIITLFM